jgi:hypothetical protein
LDLLGQGSVDVEVGGVWVVGEKFDDGIFQASVEVVNEFGGAGDGDRLVVPASRSSTVGGMGGFLDFDGKGFLFWLLAGSGLCGHRDLLSAVGFIDRVAEEEAVGEMKNRPMRRVRG